MATKKITQKQLEEMIREMVAKMVNEVPGEAPVMEKKLTKAEKEAKEKLVRKLKPVYGKTPKTYAIATSIAKDIAETEENENDPRFSDKYNDSPKLKGGQKNLPDTLQKAIIGSKDESVEEVNLSTAWQHSAAGRSFKKKTGKKMNVHYLDEEKLAELEERKRAIIKQLEELDFGRPAVADPEIETDTEEETITTTPPSPGRPNPFRREEDDTQVIPDLEPQGSLKDVIKRYLSLRK